MLITLIISNHLSWLLFNPPEKLQINLFVKTKVNVKHLVESQGIPHTNVGGITIKGVTYDLNYFPKDGDIINVISYQELPIITDVVYPLAFILDNHLGKLVKYLRMLGINTKYDYRFDDKTLATISNREKRILITRDRCLLMRSIISSGYCIRSKDVIGQIQELNSRYDLENNINILGRCLVCNERLLQVNASDIYYRLEPLTIKYYDQFHFCSNCNKVYWQGSHYQNMIENIGKIFHY
jgi:uncharacterized protein with PIN domain